MRSARTDTKYKIALGMLGWSMLTNLVIVMGPYFYLPPEGDDLPARIPDTVWFGIVNLLMIIVSLGRVVDAFYDPFIAHYSDRFKGKNGRRIPFLRFFALPASLFCALSFFPPGAEPQTLNAVWLTITLILFFISATGFVIPLNALIPEISESREEQLELSIWSQGGFVIGIILAALTNNYAAWFLEWGITESASRSVQIAVVMICVLSACCMIWAAYGIPEMKLRKRNAESEPLIAALKKAFSIPRFRYYIIADLSFYIALSLISTGLVYYLTVLAGESKELGGLLMGIMVCGSLVFFPLVKRLCQWWSRKTVVLAGLAVMAIAFFMISQLGTLPGSPKLWLYAVSILASFPVAALGIVPIALLADIADKEGRGNEGVLFAVKYFFVKIGQTIGIAAFAFFTIYGIDPGDDLGLRLNGYFGAALCIAGLLVFRKFRE